MCLKMEIVKVRWNATIKQAINNRRQVGDRRLEYTLVVIHPRRKETKGCERTLWNKT